MTLIEKQASSIEFFVKHKKAVHELIDNVHILRYEVDIKGNLKPGLALFIGNSAKPTSNYYYSTPESREEKINEVVERQREHLADKKEKLDARKAFKPTAKPGDIFVSSWGYEQTNVDFYLLQEVKGKTGTFISIGSETVEGSQYHDSDKVVADPTRMFGEPFKKLISQSGQSEYISLKSYEYCHKWSGCSQHRSWGY